MKVTLSKSVFAVTAILFGLVACANDADPPADTDTADAGTNPTSTIPSTGDAATAAKVCPSTCKTDSECQSECPTISGGIQCCDTVMDMCRPVTGSTCAKTTPTDDGGTTPTY